MAIVDQRPGRDHHTLGVTGGVIGYKPLQDYDYACIQALDLIGFPEVFKRGMAMSLRDPHLPLYVRRLGFREAFAAVDRYTLGCLGLYP